MFVALLGSGVARAGAHGSSTAVTWNREMSRIVFEKCASCHRPGGTALSDATYPEAQPRSQRDQGRRAVPAVVHDAVASIKGVESESEGEEPRRQVVVSRSA